jgi:hypothetical protein
VLYGLKKINKEEGKGENDYRGRNIKIYYYILVDKNEKNHRERYHT